MSIDKMTLDLVGEYVKQNNVKLLETAGVPAVSTEEGNAIIEKVDGIYSKDFSTDIANLESRSVINKSMRFLSLRNSTTQSLTANSIIKFDTVVDSFGNLEYNTTNNTIKLKKGSIWDIRVSIIAGTSGYTYFQIVNANTGAPISTVFSTISPNYNSTENDKSYVSKLYKCEEDIDICVKVIKIGTTAQTLSYNSADNTYSTFEVVETAMSYSLDPVVYAQDHEINYYEFGMTANYNVAATNNGGNNIPITKVINGDLPVNADGTITIPANKKYKVTLVNSILTGYSVLDIKQDNVIIGGSSVNYGNNNTNITSSTVFAYTKLKTVDSKLALYSATTSTSTIMYQFFRVILEEIKNPVIVEYTKIKEVSNDLMSSEISQESPIGTVIFSIDNKTPEHYLPLNGTTYNIADYLQFANWIKTRYGSYNYWGGDGVTTFAVPSYLPWEVDDGYLFRTNPVTLCTINTRTYYKTGIGDVISCVIYDSSFTMPIMISTDENALQGNANNDLITPLWQFQIAGSFDYDGLTLYVAYMGAGFVGTVSSGGLAKRINVKPTNPLANGTNINITSIIEAAKEVLTSINTKVLIKYIKYESTHLAVNQYGGFQIDTLWEGNALNNATITLAHSYKNYDIIYICCSYNNSFLGSSPFSVLSIKQGDYLCVDVPSIASTYADNTGRVRIVSETSMTLTNATNISIYKILGMKGSVPTIIEGGVL